MPYFVAQLVLSEHKKNELARQVFARVCFRVMERQAMQTEIASDALAYNVTKAARVAGMSREALYRLWADGHGPRRRKMPGRKRSIILRADLVDWLASLPDVPDG